MADQRDAEIGEVHLLSEEHRHHSFDNSLPPALTVRSGDTVVFRCLEACDGQITPDSTVEDLKTLDWGRIHALTGPVAIEGAEPGDVVKAEVLELEHEGWGWTSVFPGFGILADDFGDHFEHHTWRTGDDGRAEFRPGIRVPVEPFFGIMGVAPAEPGAHGTMPPRRVGGNLDIRHLVRGSTAFFPVEVAGALFSVGDGHLGMGDGEVCGLAMEAPLTGTIRLSLIKDKPIPYVQCEVPAGTTSKSEGMGYYVTSAVGPDMQENARNAVRAMIDRLEAEHGLTRPEAYMLCSAAGDLKIAVAVLGEGHVANVTFHLPHAIFVG